MLMLLLIAAYVALGLPFVSWLARRLAQASGDDAAAIEPASG